MKRTRFAPDFIRRPVESLPGCTKRWEFYIRIFPWKVPENFAPKGHGVGRLPFLLVRVFETTEAMDAAIDKLQKRWINKNGQGSVPETIGFVCPTPRAVGKKHRRLSHKKPFAEMFLLRPTPLCRDHRA